MSERDSCVDRERKGEMDGIGGRLKVGTKENGRIAKS